MSDYNKLTDEIFRDYSDNKIEKERWDVTIDEENKRGTKELFMDMNIR